MINVTKAYLPEKIKYKKYIDKIYESGWLTNNGNLLRELESRLQAYLGVKNIILVANGSLALQLAYKALELNGQVITTPFSFAATVSTMVWEGLQPIFSDIDELSYNMDPNNVEKLVTGETSAIVPVHVYGNPCEVENLKKIADNYNLKIVYDAAHAFDVVYHDSSGSITNILNYGDISTISFHATKIFHTIEGGAVVTNSDEIARKVRLLINFGITGPTSIESVGTNAKMNEFEAAMGLCVLDEMEVIKSERKNIWSRYKNELFGKVQFQQWNIRSENNHSYAPILLESEDQLLKINDKLKSSDIFTRRYFYPSLDSLNYLKEVKPINNQCKNSQKISSRIMCLPIYPGLTEAEQQKICSIIKKEI